MIKVGVVDDHAVVRAGLRDLLNAQTDMKFVCEGETGRDAVTMVREHALDVLIMDLMMPIHSGVDAIAGIKARAEKLAVLIYSGYPEQLYAPALMREGAQAYIHKESPIPLLLEAIRTVAAGRRYITPAVADALLGNDRRGVAPHELLSPREFQVFLKLAQGIAPGGIASTLCLSIKTVSTYRTRVLHKMSLHSNSELTYYAVKCNLLG